MVRYSVAEQLLRPGEAGLLIFTDGTNLTVNGDRTGSTGRWVLDPLRRVDLVVIYKRPADADTGAELLLARPGDIEGPNSEGRYLLRLRDVQPIGETPENWHKFASGGANPIRYVART